MAKANEREPQEPTEEQRASLANAILLRQYCDALGVEWDGEILADNSWQLDEVRYLTVHLNVIEALYARLGIMWPSDRQVLGFPRASNASLELTLSYKTLIELGRRAGWI